MKRARYRLGYVADKINGAWYWAKSEEDLAAKKVQVFTPGPKVNIGGYAADVNLNEEKTKREEFASVGL